jgi:hypothetical protein
LVAPADATEAALFLGVVQLREDLVRVRGWRLEVRGERVGLRVRI